MVDRKVWFLFDVLGMLMVLIGTVGYIEAISLDAGLSLALFVIGFAMILVAAFFIHKEGVGVRKEIKILEDRRAMSFSLKAIPDDDTYVVDLTDGIKVLSYDNVFPKNEREYMERMIAVPFDKNNGFER